MTGDDGDHFLLWLFSGRVKGGETSMTFVTGMSLSRYLVFNELQENPTVGSGGATAKLSKIRVKFLKFDAVERLWNTAMEPRLLERV